MRKSIPLIFALGLVIAACGAPQVPDTAPTEQQVLAVEDAAPTPFPMQDGAFIGAPEDFALLVDELGSDFAAEEAGSSVPNSDVLEARPDGQAYLEATGRQAGWRVQFNRGEGGTGPLYVINVVNTYSSPAGAQLTLSREWHDDVWSLIDSGALVRLPDIPDLEAEQLVWQNSSGTIGVELVYRNLYILFTGPTEGEDQYQFLADLARAHLDWIQAREL